MFSTDADVSVLIYRQLKENQAVTQALLDEQRRTNQLLERLTGVTS